MAATDTDRTADEAARCLVDPAAFTDMARWHRVVGEARRAAPTLRVEGDDLPPFTALLRYDDVVAVSRDNATWHNTSQSVLQAISERQGMLDAGLPEPATLVHLDGSTHRDHRQVTNDWFKPASVRHRQPRIDALADHFVGRMRELGGRCDFARDVAQPFTLRVIMDIYGVPESDEAMMLELTQGLFGAGDPEFMGDAANPLESLIASVMKFIGYFDGITADRRATPRDDLASVIANGQPGGCPMGDAERLWYFIIVATAGHDTTSFALSGGLEAMLAEPDQWAMLRDDPSLAANGAEESIRMTSPVRHFMRHATVATEVAGVAFEPGDRILLSYPSANRDEATFADADRFDLRRPNADRLISFGGGAHFCLGSQFARREVRTLLARLAAEVAEIEVDGEPEWAASNFVSGVKHLPVRYRFAHRS